MNDNIEPQRLLDDPNVLGPGLRQLRGDLNAAVGAAPLRYDVEAGLARFQAQVAQMSAAGTGAASGSSVAIGKVVAGVAGLLVVGGAAWALLTGGPSASDAPTENEAEAVAVAPTETAAQPEAQPPAPEASSSAVAVVADDEGAPTQAQASEPAPAPVPEAPAPAVVPPEDPQSRASTRSKRREASDAAKDDGGDQASDFLREAKKVQQAKKALDRDPTRTLRLLREVEREFPNGQLTEEREGLFVLALLGTGKTGEGKRRADAYLARYPRGTLATRVRRALAQLP